MGECQKMEAGILSVCCRADVPHSKELAEDANKVFLISKNKGVSKVN